MLAGQMALLERLTTAGPKSERLSSAQRVFSLNALHQLGHCKVKPKPQPKFNQTATLADCVWDPRAIVATCRTFVPVATRRYCVSTVYLIIGLWFVCGLKSMPNQTTFTFFTGPGPAAGRARGAEWDDQEWASQACTPAAAPGFGDCQRSAL